MLVGGVVIISAIVFIDGESGGAAGDAGHNGIKVIPLGDVDCNARVDPVDALRILQFDAGLSGASQCMMRGDIDGDGRVNSGDAVRVLFYAAGLVAL